MPVMSLKTTSRVKPTILNGRRITQISGNRKIRTSANGQHMTNRIHHSMIAIKVLISFFAVASTNGKPNKQSLKILVPVVVLSPTISLMYNGVFNTVQVRIFGKL